MHVAVGGWMGAFNTAALDPIFWLHHSNIDRLWEVWLKRDSSNTDPAMTAWRTKVSFKFNDGLGAVATLTPSQVINTAAAPLFYVYEDTSDPIGGTGGLNESVAVSSMATPTMTEMVGATSNAVPLTGHTSVATFTASAPTGPALESMAAPAKTFLHFDNVTAKARTTGYSVYLNLPVGADPAAHPERFAGNLAMFGVDAMSHPDDEHPGDGLHYRLDVSRVVRALAAKSEWDAKNIHVTMVPKARKGGGLEAMAVDAGAQIGRISLHVG